MAKRGPIEQTTGPVIDLSDGDRAEFRRLRKSRNLSQRELAAKIGVSTGTISNIETGRSGQPRREPYLEALRFLRSGETAVQTDQSTRLKSVVDGYLALDERGKATVEALIESQRAATSEPKY